MGNESAVSSIEQIINEDYTDFTLTRGSRFPARDGHITKTPQGFELHWNYTGIRGCSEDFQAANVDELLHLMDENRVPHDGWIGYVEEEEEMAP